MVKSISNEIVIVKRCNLMILRIDHLVLTVRSLEYTCEFYARILNFVRRDTPGKPTALHFGCCKINVHQVDLLFEPNARIPTPGSSDFCLITDEDMSDFLKHLATEGIPVETGPVVRIGTEGSMTSVYFRDPDQNLIEVSKYI